MRHHHFYDPVTGLFTDRTFATDMSENYDRHLEVNTPAGCRAVEGVYDHLSQRVDVATGEVVEYQPSAPSELHEWNATTKRWQLSDAAQAKAAAHAAARQRIAALRDSQHDLVRKLLLTGDADARVALQALDAEITALQALQ